MRGNLRTNVPHIAKQTREDLEEAVNKTAHTLCIAAERAGLDCTDLDAVGERVDNTVRAFAEQLQARSGSQARKDGLHAAAALEAMFAWRDSLEAQARVKTKRRRLMITSDVADRLHAQEEGNKHRALECVKAHWNGANWANSGDVGLAINKLVREGQDLEKILASDDFARALCGTVLHRALDALDHLEGAIIDVAVAIWRLKAGGEATEAA